MERKNNEKRIMQVWCLRYHNKAGNAAPASENARRSCIPD